MEDLPRADDNDQRRSISRQRTPGVASRVRNATPEEQRLMQSAKQQLRFGDDDEECANGNRGAPSTRPKPSGIPGDASLSFSSLSATALPSAEDFPDQTLILERLASIRQHKRQVLDLIDKLKHDSGDGEIDKDMLRKLIEAYDNFKDQEDQYILILQKILALKSEFTTALEEGAAAEAGPENVPQQLNMKSGGRVAGAANPRPPVPYMEMLPDTMRDSGFSSASKAGETDEEMQALVEQRNMLKRMLRQQEELRALQGRQTAQESQYEGEVTEEMKSDYDVAYQQVHMQQESLAAKRRELEDLKSKLDHVRQFYTDGPAEAEETISHLTSPVVDGGQQRRQLEDKLHVLRGKKQRMDDIISELNALQGDEDGQQVQSAASNGHESLVNQTGARPKEPLHQAAKQRPDQSHNSRTNLASGVPQPEQIRRKLMELEATKSRLAQLQTLVTDLEGNSGPAGAQRRLGVTPQLMRLVNELESDGEQELENGSDNSGDAAAMNMQMRAAYQSKLNEQRDAVDRLQEEHARLTAIKNQMLKLNPLADPLAAERAAAAAPAAMGFPGGGRFTKEDFRRELQAAGRDQRSQRPSVARSTPEQRLNNTRDSEQSIVMQPRNRISALLAANAMGASALPSNLDELDIERQAGRIRGRTDSGSSAIANNPQLASFRRNNQLDESRKQRRQQERTASVQRSAAARDDASTPTDCLSADRSLRRRRSSSNIEHQYNQLQQHIDSIRLIFQDLMKEHEDYSAQGVQQQQQQPFPGDLRQQPRLASTVSDGGRSQAMQSTPPTWDVLGLTPSAMAVHQHQLMLSMLACQQQLQIQQIEMRYLQQLCQELWQTNYNEGVRTRSGSVNSIQQQQPAGGLQFGAAGFVPFDGRPLSSASLYNLLAPNPYLTMPYYPPPQFGPQNFGPSTRGLMRANNGVHSLPRDQGILNNSYVGPAASGAGKSNRGAEGARAMSSSVVCQEGQHRGDAVVDRMIVSDSELSVVADGSSPFKVGASARQPLAEYTSSGNKAKLNLEDPYSKSNVNKSNKNSNFMATQTNGVIPELPSRASSTCGAIPQSGHASVLENGSVTPEQFDAMRELIYSEVATLISQNEQRPTFLLELFRELQLLTNDYLRTRALEAIRNTLNRYLIDDSETPSNVEPEDRWMVSLSSRALDSSLRTAARAAATLGTPERNVELPVLNHQPSEAAADTAREYGLVTVPGAAVASTPQTGDTTSNGFEKPTNNQKRFEHLEGNKDVKNSPLTNESATAEPSDRAGVARSQSRDFVASNAIRSGSGSKVDVTGLEQQIQTIVDDLIPFVRGNVDAECTPQLLQYIRKLVLELTALKCVPAESFTTFFRLQLSSILDDTLAKFRGQKLHECGAELLADISEVVFNELGFFRLMQNIDTTRVSRSHGPDSETSTTNAETSESAPLDDIVSGTDGDRMESELSSSRQSSLDEELSPMSVPSEMSEDLSARTAISVSKEAMKIATMEIVLPGQETAGPAGQSDSPEQSIENAPHGRDGHRQSIETVLMAPLMVQVTAATDEEITTSNNSSPSSSSASQSMHTAGGGNSITSDQVEMMKTPPTGDSRETTPPDDVDEVPEQLEHEPTQPTDTNEITFDLAFEPHPENKDVQLTLISRPSRESDGGAEEEEEEEDEDEAQTDGEDRATTPIVTARAVAYVAESVASSDLGSADGSAISVASTVN